MYQGVQYREPGIFTLEYWVEEEREYNLLRVELVWWVT